MHARIKNNYTSIERASLILNRSCLCERLFCQLNEYLLLNRSCEESQGQGNIYIGRAAIKPTAGGAHCSQRALNSCGEGRDFHYIQFINQTVWSAHAPCSHLTKQLTAAKWLQRCYLKKPFQGPNPSNHNHLPCKSTCSPLFT